MRTDKTKCSTCNVTLTPDNAYKNKRGYNGLDSKCKPCKVSYSCVYQKENPEVHNAANRRYSQNHKATRNSHTANRREKLNSIKLTAGEQMFVNEYYKVAAELTASGEPHQVDHIIPIAKGGLHAPWNLQVLTAKENQLKGAKWN
jgi:5-methylcytosine-specific restriction endonuclease McrA